MLPTRSNKIYSITDAGSGKVTVGIQSTYGLSDGDLIEIINNDAYLGTYTISNTMAGSFEIVATYDIFVYNGSAIWQISRPRPTTINPEGESIDTLRQTVNQIGSDVGDKDALNDNITDNRDIVKAINSLVNLTENDQLKALIRSIAIS